MKEHPILFNGEMVRAVLDGRKTQTRRVIKPQPYIELGPDGEPGPLTWDGAKTKFSGLPQWLAQDYCPHGQPGDRLWVRETWASYGPEPRPTLEQQLLNPGKRLVFYKATDLYQGDRWKPSILMPRWASRITLEITGVRVERVQEITYEDAWAEGSDTDKGASDETNKMAFEMLWDSTYAKRGYGWDKNPWVWVIEFKRMETK